MAALQCARIGINRTQLKSAARGTHGFVRKLDAGTQLKVEESLGVVLGDIESEDARGKMKMQQNEWMAIMQEIQIDRAAGCWSGEVNEKHHVESNIQNRHASSILAVGADRV